MEPESGERAAVPPREKSVKSAEAPTTALTAVILAAGRGDRLAGGGQDLPKPLVPVLGLSLLERAILSCQEAGVTDFLVVVGHRKEEIRSHLEGWADNHGVRIRLVENELWREGNGTSVLACEPLLSTAFLVLMCDHLFDPQLVRRLIADGTDDNLCYLLVDQQPERVFDIEDATRVRLESSRITEIGKGLEAYAGVDAGIFLCRPFLFDALREARQQGDGTLTAGVRKLTKIGKIHAVDLGEGFWLDVDTPKDLKHARRILSRQVVKTNEDGFVASWLNRRLSLPISRWLLSTRSLALVSPNALSGLSFAVVVLGAVLFGFSSYVRPLVGGILIQLGSILDGCDGEVARLTFKTSHFGAWFDTILDRYGDTLVAAGVTYGFWRAHPTPWVWLGGCAALSGFLLASYSKKEFVLRYRRDIPAGIVMRLVKRDLRLFVIFLGALFGYPYHAMVAVGLLSHFGVAQLVYDAWHS